MATMPEVDRTAKEDEGRVNRPAAWLATRMLCWREIVRFLRQRNRVVGAVGQPLIFWLFFSAGFDRTFQLDSPGAGGGVAFREYYFPGTLELILLFTAIFATISVIEDRREGFLQSVLVAPIPRWAMVLGKVLGGTLLAILQGVAFLAIALLLDIDWTWIKALQLTLLMSVTAFGLTSMGFIVAWRMESTHGFHAIMSVVLMPLWLLSGAFFPVPPVDAHSSIIQIAMHWAMRTNPLTYSVGGLHQLLFDGPISAALTLPSLPVCWTVTSLFALAMFVFACRTADVRTTGDLL